LSILQNGMNILQKLLPMRNVLGKYREC
jgi:hypothetical protein